MPNCQNCQAPIADGAMICSKCGAAVLRETDLGFPQGRGETPNRDIMTQARQALKGRWGLAIGTCLIYALIVGGVGQIPSIGSIASLLISGPMILGLCIFALSLSRQQEPALEQIFQGFSKFGVALGAYLLQALFVLLWSLLLIIPGIVAGLAYSQTFYIIAEDDSIGPREAIRKSKAIMQTFGSPQHLTRVLTEELE